MLDGCQSIGVILKGMVINERLKTVETTETTESASQQLAQVEIGTGTTIAFWFPAVQSDELQDL